MKSVDEYHSEAMALCEDCRCKEALTLLDEGLEKYPESQALLGAKAMVLLAFKRYEEALELHARLTPEAAELINRGNLLLAMDRFDDALASFEDAIILKSKEKGVCIIGHAAGEATEKAITVKPMQAPMTADAFYGKGEALYGLERYKDAVTAYDYALSLEEFLADTYHNFANVYLSKGKALEKLGRVREAAEAFEKAIDVHDYCITKQPDDAFNYFEKGEALMELGRHDEAMTVFRKAKELDPTIYVTEVDGELN